MGTTRKAESPKEEDLLVYIFVFPSHLTYITPYGTTTWGVYNEPPFVQGGQSNPPFPVVIQCCGSVANQVQELMLKEVNTIYAEKIENNVNTVLLHLQNSAHVRQVCEIMDRFSPYFWTLILAKQVGVFFNEASATTAWTMPTSLTFRRAQTHNSFAGALYAMITHGNTKYPRFDWVSNTLMAIPSTPVSAASPCSPHPTTPSTRLALRSRSDTPNPQTPTRNKGKAKEAVLQPSQDEYDKWLEAEIEKDCQEIPALFQLSPSILRASPVVNMSAIPASMQPTLPEAQTSVNLAPTAHLGQDTSHDVPTASPSQVPEPSTNTHPSIAFYTSFSGESVVPRSPATRLGHAGTAFFQHLGFCDAVVDQIGLLYEGTGDYTEFVESMGQVYSEVSIGLVEHIFFLFETKC
ncbi:hypothetical protein Moror_11813 [Moniliophthora roreri MCA 2997]|uniref:Uncharacterized protein n=2 Tax=Moniliophthora roreri TaxID=221103 RepID=V2WN04_MONRO|nr:hypothetical protein Moror_11813 [Moniliophthora roreri MCA 2997]KAI3612897.1 hypothetical protein WG66_005325 [Moniliophthora roreri]